MFGSKKRKDEVGVNAAQDRAKEAGLMDAPLQGKPKTAREKVVQGQSMSVRVRNLEWALSALPQPLSHTPKSVKDWMAQVETIANGLQNYIDTGTFSGEEPDGSKDSGST